MKTLKEVELISSSIVMTAKEEELEVKKTIKSQYKKFKKKLIDDFKKLKGQKNLVSTSFFKTLTDYITDTIALVKTKIARKEGKIGASVGVDVYISAAEKESIKASVIRVLKIVFQYNLILGIISSLTGLLIGTGAFIAGGAIGPIVGFMSMALCFLVIQVTLFQLTIKKAKETYLGKIARRLDNMLSRFKKSKK